MYGNLQTKYLHKKENDVYVIEPGMVYYWGNNYLYASPGLTIIESRGEGFFATVRSNIFLTQRLSVYNGLVVGEWL